MAKTAHQCIDRRTASRLRRILFQPFPKSRIEGLVLRSSHQPCLLDEVFIGTQSNVFHTNTVYTIIVRILNRAS